MTTFVLTYEKISSSYQGAKIHNFCVSEKKNVGNCHRKTDKCQQINGQQGDKKKPEHVSSLRLDRCAAVLRHEETHPQENTAYDKGPVGGDRPAPQETLVPGDTDFFSLIRLHPPCLN